MGCNSSSLDRLPAVALCRDRCKFIDETLRQSYALADAHVAHMESLRSLGPALLYFFDQFEDSGETVTETSAALLSKSPPHHSTASSSDSDEHVVLHSESESENAEKESQLFTHYSHSRRYDYLHRNAVLSPASDNVTFMNYVQPIYDSYTPPPSNIGGFFTTKPPSPPPPPSNSAWDFLNFFEPYEKYQIEYSHGASGYAEAEPTVEKEEGKGINGHETGKNEDVGNGKASEVENGEAKNKEAEISVTEKKPPATEESAAKRFCEAVKEIQILFEKVSDSGNPILEMLDVGKFRYHRKFDFHPISCKMMHVFTPSNSLGINCMESSTSLLRSANYQGVDLEKGINYANICSTLSKLCQWEKKLYREVKAEEKLRILHQKKCKQLRRMKIKDEDAQKIDSVQTFIGILATKMKISIQVVDKISNTISKLMEEELWPQINTFILMFLRMWKDMQECNKCKYQRLVETKTLEVSSFNRKQNGNANIDAGIKLKSELQKWNLSFSNWIHVQKCYVKALNGWLIRCLVYEPEEIPNDDSTPSPTKVGAPAVFVICNKWSRTVDNISEKNVIEAVNGFMFRVNELLEKHVLELQQKLTLDKELEKKVKMLEKQEQKMHKVMQARERKMVPIAKESRDDIVDTVSLQSGLKEIFFAMERFTATTASLYEELCQQVKQDHPV